MSDSNEDKTDSLVLKAFRWPWLVLWAVVTFWVVFFISSIGVLNDLKFTFSPSMNLEQLNYFGGSFNVLTSLFTSLTFAGLVISIIIQHKELRLQRKTLKSQQKELRMQRKALELQHQEMSASREQFEGQREALQNQELDNKFFQMLKFLHNNTDRLRVKLVIFDNVDRKPSSKKTFDGIDVFDGLYEMFFENLETFDDVKYKNKTEIIEVFKKEFKNFNNEYDTTFKYYYLNLFQLINYVDLYFENKVNWSKDQKIIESKKYTNIIRAQLTKNQLVLLAFNGIGMQYLESANNSDRYIQLIEKYSFLEHLLENDLLSERKSKFAAQVLDSYTEKAYGKNDSLFNAIKDKVDSV